MSELSPLGDILVLGLTRDSYRVYKTVIGMCGLVSPILRLFRVTESSFSCRSVPAGVASCWLVTSRNKCGRDLMLWRHSNKTRELML